MGKIFSEAEAEIEKCAHEADWYAERGPKIMEDEPAPTGTVNAYVSYLPLGPILAIMPWNFPIWQLTRMAINTQLLELRRLMARWRHMVEIIKQRLRIFT